VTIEDADDAKDALDRVTIPQDVIDRIGPTTLPRSSIVISDEPLSKETNYRTEFVVVLNDQPQGGFITRKPTTDVYMANSEDDGGSGFGFFQRTWGAPAQPADPRQLYRQGQPGPYPRPVQQGQYYRPVQRGWFW
jgi:hypothetical protein